MANNAIQKISARAKQIRKKHPSKAWMACIKQASAEYRSGSKKVGKVAKKRKPAKKSKYRQTGTSSKVYDQQRHARPPGARIPKGGKRVTYYERRKNRSDVPGRLTGIGGQNEVALRRLQECNRHLIEAESRVNTLKREYKALPRGMAKKLFKRNIIEAQKYYRVVRKEISMLKTILR